MIAESAHKKNNPLAHGWLVVTMTAAYLSALFVQDLTRDLWLLWAVTAFLLTWAATSLWSAAKWGGIDFHFRGIAAPMWVFLVIVLLSTLWSTSISSSFVCAWVVAALPITFLLWTHQTNTAEAWPRLWSLLMIATTGVAAWGIIDVLFGAPLATASFIDSNALGALFNLVFFPTLFRYLNPTDEGGQSRLDRYLPVVALLSMTAGLFATHSRGAIGLWLLLCLVSFCLTAPLGRGRYRIFAALMLVAFANHLADRFSPAGPMKTPILEIENDSSLTHRLMLYRSALEIYKEHPLLGTGLGTFKYHYPAHRDLRENTTTGDLVHNDYLQFLLEGGPLLLLAFAALLLGTLGTLRRIHGPVLLRNRTSRPTPEVMESCGLLLGVLALFMHATVNFIFYSLPLSMLAGLFLAQANKSATPPGGTPGLHLPVRPSVAKACIVVVLGLPCAMLAVDATASYLFVAETRHPWIHEIRGDEIQAHKIATLLLAVRPSNADALRTRASIDHYRAKNSLAQNQQGFARLACRDYLRLLKVRTVDSYGLNGLALLILEFPGLSDCRHPDVGANPEALAKLAIHYNPTSAQPYFTLLDFYESKGLFQEAYELLTQHALPWFEMPIPLGAEMQARAEGRLLLERALVLSRLLKRDADTRALTEILSNHPPAK